MMLSIACHQVGSRPLLLVQNLWWEALHGHRRECCTIFRINWGFSTRVRKHTPFKSPCTTIGLQPCRYETPELICTSYRWLNVKIIAGFQKTTDILWITDQQKDYAHWGSGLKCRYCTTGRSLQLCRKTVRRQRVEQCFHVAAYAMQRVRLEGAKSSPSGYCEW